MSRRPLPVTIAVVCAVLMAVVSGLLAGLVVGPATVGRGAPAIGLVALNALTWAATLTLLVGVLRLLTRGEQLLVVIGSWLSLVAVWAVLILTVLQTEGRGLSFVPAVLMVSLLPLAAVFLPQRADARLWRDRIARRGAVPSYDERSGGSGR